MNPAAGMLYLAKVVHQRRYPVGYRFDYRVFSLLLDIDRLEQTARDLRVFSHNRFNLLSLHDSDHGPRDGTPLRPWVDRLLAAQGIDLEGGRVRLLAMPRLFGYVFNPISLWYCEHADGRLRAVLCEVSNTFGDHHCYLLHERGLPLPSPFRARAMKRLHVSPLIGMHAEYAFQLDAPGERVGVHIREFAEHGLMLVATLAGRARELNDRNLLRAVAGLPLMTLKVMAAIHWQALRIWLRGAPYHPRPAPPEHETS